MVFVKVNLGVDQGIMSHQLRPESRQERFIRHERGSKQANNRPPSQRPSSKPKTQANQIFLPIARYLHPWQEEG